MSLATLPGSPETVVMGTSNAGVFLSTDGSAWTRLDAEAVEGALYSVAATSTWVYAATVGAGVWRLPLSGGSWEPLNAGAVGEDFWKLAVDSVDPETVYAVSFSGDLYRFTQGDPMGEAMTQPNGLYVSSLASAPDGALLAGTVLGEIWISEDGGQSWDLVYQPPSASPWRPGFEFHPVTVMSGFAFSPGGELSYAAVDGGAGLLVSTDGGRSWVERSGGLSDQAVLAVAPGPAGVTYLGTAAGVFKSAPVETSASR
jgi:hypothetical protein